MEILTALADKFSSNPVLAQLLATLPFSHPDN
jgi:hypothetical protein